MRTATRVTSESDCCPKCKYCVKGQLINPATGFITCPECGNCFRLDLRDPMGSAGQYGLLLGLGAIFPFIAFAVFISFNLFETTYSLYLLLAIVQLVVYAFAFLSVHLTQPGLPGNRKYGRKLLISIPLSFALNMPTVLLVGALILYAINSGDIFLIEILCQQLTLFPS